MLTFRDPCGNELGAKNADKKLTADPERSEGLLAIFGLGNRTCKPNFVRSMNAAGRSFLWATHYCGAQATYPEVVARRAGTLPACAGIPPYLVLLRVGFALPAALLRRRCALTAPFHPYLSLAARAVCFLWHFPSNRLQPAVPDVIRHTALRSSDFPPVYRRATVRSGCQRIHYSAAARPRSENGLRPCFWA